MGFDEDWQQSASAPCLKPLIRRIHEDWVFINQALVALRYLASLWLAASHCWLPHLFVVGFISICPRKGDEHEALSCHSCLGQPSTHMLLVTGMMLGLLCLGVMVANF